MSQHKESTFKDELISGGKLLLGLSWQATKFIVRNTPKAIVTLAHAKRELIDTIAQEYQNIQKHIREEQLNEKIRALKERKNV
jgi:alpha-ketoglutarate-dependent taurine dioxygenase